MSALLLPVQVSFVLIINYVLMMTYSRNIYVLFGCDVVTAHVAPSVR